MPGTRTVMMSSTDNEKGPGRGLPRMLERLAMRDVEQAASKLVETIVGDPDTSTLAVYQRTEADDGSVFEDWVPFRFKLIPEEVGFYKSILYQLIIYAGGVVSTRKEDQHCLTILNDMKYVIDPSIDAKLPPDTYSSRLIYDAIVRKRRRLERPEARDYLLTPSNYGDYNPWKILRKELKWSDLRPRGNNTNSPPKVLSAQQVARMGFEAFLEKYPRAAPVPAPVPKPPSTSLSQGQSEVSQEMDFESEVGGGANEEASLPCAGKEQDPLPPVPEKVAVESQPSPSKVPVLVASNGSEEVYFGCENATRANPVSPPKGPTPMPPSALPVESIATGAVDSIPVKTHRDRLTPPPPSPAKPKSPDRNLGKSDDEVTILVPPTPPDLEEQMPTFPNPVRTQVIPRSAVTRDKYEGEGGFFRTQDMDLDELLKDMEVNFVPDSGSPVKDDDYTPIEATVPLKPAQSQPETGPTPELVPSLSQEIPANNSSGPASTQIVPRTGTRAGSSRKRRKKDKSNGQDKVKDKVDKSNVSSGSDSTVEDIPASEPTETSPKKSVPPVNGLNKVKLDKNVVVKLVRVSVPPPRSSAKSECPTPAPDPESSRKRRKGEEPKSKLNTEKTKTNSNIDSDSTHFSEMDSIHFDDDSTSTSDGEIPVTPKRSAYSLPEDQAIIDKLRKNNNFVYSSSMTIFKYMAKEKEFKGRRSYQSLSNRWRRHIKPRLLRTDGDHPYKFSGKDLEVLKKAMAEINIKKYSHVCPRNLKF